jgi:hypothetical protein
MSSKYEQVFGYWNAAGIAKKVCKVRGKISSERYLLDLVVIQYDARKLLHFTLHNREPSGKATRYHIQAQCPESIAPEDRDNFPEVIQSPLPDLRTLGTIYALQAIPIWAKADDERGFYPTMTQRELRRYLQNIADFRALKYDSSTPGLLELHLVPESAAAALKRFEEDIRSSCGRDIRLWQVWRNVIPWILCHVRQREFLSSGH